MPVDKYGRGRIYSKQNQQFTDKDGTVVSLTQMNDTFIRRDGTNTQLWNPTTSLWNNKYDRKYSSKRKQPRTCL